MNLRSFSSPSFILAEILGSTALLLGSLAAQSAVATREISIAKVPARVPGTGDLFAFGDLGSNHLVNVYDSNPSYSSAPNYRRHRPEIGASVADARHKNDPGSLRLVAWDDMTKLAAEIDDPVYKAMVAREIVQGLVTYDTEKAAYATVNRVGTKWEIWDQTLVQTIADGDEAEGEGICLDFADAVMETALDEGIEPKNIGVAIMDLIPIKGDRSHPDRHANGIFAAGAMVLVLGQKAVFYAPTYFNGENPESPGNHARITQVETLGATGYYVEYPDESHASAPQQDIKYTPSPHDQKIKDQIDKRHALLMTRLLMLGIMEKPKDEKPVDKPALVAPSSYKLPCGALFDDRPENFPRPPEACRFAVAPYP